MRQRRLTPSAVPRRGSPSRPAKRSCSPRKTRQSAPSTMNVLDQDATAAVIGRRSPGRRCTPRAARRRWPDDRLHRGDRFVGPPRAGRSRGMPSSGTPQRGQEVPSTSSGAVSRSVIRRTEPLRMWSRSIMSRAMTSATEIRVPAAERVAPRVHGLPALGRREETQDRLQLCAGVPGGSSFVRRVREDDEPDRRVGGDEVLERPAQPVVVLVLDAQRQVEDDDPVERVGSTLCTCTSPLRAEAAAAATQRSRRRRAPRARFACATSSAGTRRASWVSTAGRLRIGDLGLGP